MSDTFKAGDKVRWTRTVMSGSSITFTEQRGEIKEISGTYAEVIRRDSAGRKRGIIMKRLKNIELDDDSPNALTRAMKGEAEKS